MKLHCHDIKSTQVTNDTENNYTELVALLRGAATLQKLGGSKSISRGGSR